MKRYFPIFGLIAAFVLSCGDDIKKSFTSPTTLTLSGTIAGKVLDRCTGAPIKGILISVAGKSAQTTNANGEFFFTDVPVTTDDSYNGYGTFWDNYLVLIDFTAYNKAKPDSLKYPNYVSQSVDVAFTDLNDGDNGAGSVGGEAGSGADTPVQGLVSHIDIEAGMTNTTITGQVVDQVNYDPVAGATVYLKNNVPAVVAQTTTDVNGNYTFTRVENGASFTISAMNASKTMTGSQTVDLTCNQLSQSLSAQVQAQRIVLSLSDDVAPFVTSISPENNADANPTGLTVVYVFSEPIKQTAYTRTDLPKGNNTIIDDITFTYNGLKKSMGPVSFAASWNGSFDQLTITPATLISSAKYTVSYAAGMSAKLTDAKGNALANAGTAIVGDFLNTESLNFTTAGSTTSPATPILLRDTLTVSPVNWNGGNVRLRWTQDESTVKVKHFDIFKKIGNGAFDRVATNVRSIDTTLAIATTDLHTGGLTPRAAQSVQFYVQAISINLIPGNTSNIITISDGVSPTLSNSVIDGAGTGQYDYIYVVFNEPVAVAAAENTTNYSFTDNNATVANAREAVYLGQVTGGLGGTGYKVRIKVDNGSVVGGEILTVSSSVTDLFGNGMDTNNNSITY